MTVYIPYPLLRMKKTYDVENKAGVGFINQAMKGNLKIKKTSSDGKVEGFTFRITGVNGYDSTFTTDKERRNLCGRTSYRRIHRF